MARENKLVNASIIFLGVALAFYLLAAFQSFLRPFIIALVLTFLFVPVTRYSQKQKAVLLITSLILIIGLFSLIAFGGAMLRSEATTVTQDLPTQRQNLRTSVNEAFSVFTTTFAGHELELSDYIQPTDVTSIYNSIIPNALNALTSIFSEFILVLLFLMFLLPSHDIFFQRISLTIKRSERRKFKRTLLQIEQSIRDYLVNKTLISVATAVLCAGVMFMFDVKFIFVFSLLIFALNFIPNVGSFIAVALVIVSHFLFVGFGLPLLGLAACLTLIQFLIGNIVEPKYFGDKLALSPVIILLSLLFWGYIWGVPGMFFAVPLTSIMKIILENISWAKKYAPFLS